MEKEEMWSYEEFKAYLNKYKENEPEVPFLLNGKKYMIIGFKEMVSFQRFGDNETDQSGEVFFKDLDELFHTETIDGVLLERDWDKIEKFNNHYELL